MSLRKRRAIGLYLILAISFLPVTGLRAQDRGRPGKSIGKVSVVGNLILLELDKDALGRQHLFDFSRRTIRVTPDGAGYRVENLPLQWDAEWGQKISNPHVTLHNFAFPFSGKNWDSFSVGVTGSIRFGEEASARSFGFGGFRPPDQGGVSIGRFDQLSEAASNLVNTVPAICVFFKLRMRGDRYVKELADRAVVTWDVTEPYGNIQDFTWTKTINRFQVVLHKDGAIEMSYDQLAARDAIVGIYPLISSGAERPLATLPAASHAPVAAQVDLQNLKLAVKDELFLKATLETAGPMLPEGNAGLAGIVYRINFSRKTSRASAGASPGPDAVWTIRGFAFRNRPNFRSRYFALGPGLSRLVKTSGNTISIQGLLPPALRGLKQVEVSASAFSPGSDQPVSQIPARTVALAGIRSPEVRFSSLNSKDGPFRVLYEAFHYYALPDSGDLACTVIRSLGDKFDFLAYYSDFRIDNQEAGTPSEGPRGAVGAAVTGIGEDAHPGLASYCSGGRFQWGFVQPVYAGSNQMQERPPADAPVGTPEDITFYRKQLSEISPDGQMPPYMYAMSQIGHEMGHRWAAFVSAKVGGETIPLGPVHWDRGLQAPAAFPYRRPTEASIMGGGVWQDNFDGTYTQLDDNYYVPATGYSYLDLYLMGLISPAEVPDFFLLRHLVFKGRDVNGRPIFKADRTKVTIQDVIAAEGQRVPGVDKSQRLFNTGMVMVVQHGTKPSRKLIERTNGIRKQWIKYFSICTGRRATMTANP